MKIIKKLILIKLLSFSTLINCPENVYICDIFDENNLYKNSVNKPEISNTFRQIEILPPTLKLTWSSMELFDF